jgi:citrate synthase
MREQRRQPTKESTMAESDGGSSGGTGGSGGAESGPEVHHGLEGVVAFETEIAEPDKEGSALRYRGVDIEDLVGRVPFEKVWGLLIDGAYEPGLPPAEPFNLPIHTGEVRADVQAAVAMLAPTFGMQQTYDISDEQAREDLSRVAVMVLSYAAQSARGLGQPVVPQSEVDKGEKLADRFLIRWKGEADPSQSKAIDAYWSSAAEHGMNASTFTARVITSTGADVAAAFSGAIGAMSGPLHGGAPSRVLGMIEEVEKRGDAAAYVKELLDNKERLMGFGHRVYRAEDPRARVLRRTARELNAPRYEVAEELEKAALAELRERRPDRVLETNVEFWAAIVLDFAEVPPRMFTSMFTCARTAGWSAHILEQKKTGRLIRPSAIYTGPAERQASEVDGWNDSWS